jgi:hypothetical protein
MAVFTSENIDFRYIKLNDQTHRNYLKQMFNDYIEASELEIVSSKMHSIWEYNNLYYESHMVPVGWSDEHLENFVYSNSGRIDTTQFEVRPVKQGKRKGKVFVTKNLITDVIDRDNARFADADRRTIVKTDDEERNDKLEIVIQRYYDKKITDKLQLWKQYHYPAIQQRSILGLWWTQPLWNKRLNYAKGAFEWRMYHPQDVLLDPFPTLKYFLDCRYIIVKQRVPLDEAREYIMSLNPDLRAEDIQPDEDYFEYNLPLRNRGQKAGVNARLDQFVTLYYPEFKKVYIDRFGMEGEEGKIEYEHIYYFTAVYHKKHGVLDFGISKYADPSNKNAWQFSCIPWYGKHSNLRLFPISKIEPLRKIQDIINIGWTMKMDSAYKQNMVRAFIKAKLSDKYGKLVDEFLNVSGGMFPIETDDDINKAVYPFNLQFNDRGIMEFTQAMEQSFKNQKGSNEIVGGDMPDTTRKYLSGETIKQTRADDYMRSQPEELNVNWSVSQEAMRVYSIIAKEKKITYSRGNKDTEFMELEDRDNPDKRHYIPVNVTWSFAEYEKLLAEEYPDLIEIINNPITGKPEPSYLKASAEFCKENWVTIRYMTKDPFTERELTLDEIKSSRGSEVNINHLFDKYGDKWKCDIKVEFDFGFRADKETAKALLGNLVTMVMTRYGILAMPILKRWLKMFPQLSNDVDDMMKELKELDRKQQLMTEIEKRGPEFAQMLSDLMNKFDIYIAQKQATSNTGGSQAARGVQQQTVAA